MSLAALAIRACTFLALYGRTPAERRVYDSEMVPLDDLMGGGPRPFMVIGIDEASGEPAGGRSLLASIDEIILVIEIALGEAIELPAPTQRPEDPDADPPQPGVVLIPDSAPGLEWSLDLITWQVMALLSGGQDGTPVAAGGIPGPWADLWKRFRMKLGKVARLRSGLTRDGLRLAARQIQFEIHPISDPDLGTAPAGIWAEFLAALRAIDIAAAPDFAAYHDLADAVEAAMAGPAGLGAWAIAAARLGVGTAAAEAIGITPQALVMPDVEAALSATDELVQGGGAADPIDSDRADDIAAGSWIEQDGAGAG